MVQDPIQELVLHWIAMSLQVPSGCSFTLFPYPSYFSSLKSCSPQPISIQCFHMTRLRSYILMMLVSAKFLHHKSSFFPITTNPTPCEKILRGIVSTLTLLKNPTWAFIDKSCLNQPPLCCLPLMICYISSEFISCSLLQGIAFPYFPFILIHLLIFIWNHEFLFHVIYFWMLKLCKFCY